MFWEMIYTPTSEPVFGNAQWPDFASLGGWGDLSQQTIA